MAEENAPAVAAIPTVKVTHDVPVIFCDGISNHYFGASVSKIILSRLDPAMGTNAVVQAQEAIIAQLVMPNDYFLIAVAFLQHRIKQMVEAKVLTQEQVDEAFNFWTKN